MSKFQQAAVIKDKSSASVIDFIMSSWLPLLGAPRQIIADQGREFVSEEFQEWCSSHSVLLWHAAVQAPWQNGPAERSGGTLKALLAAIVTDKVVIGDRDMNHAVYEAVAAYNADPTEDGVSPQQCVTGRQPSGQGSVLNNFAGRLAEHGVIDSDPSLVQRLALREAARVAMVRQHYSQGIRKAELARSREPTAAQPSPGDVVYFYRAQRVTKRGDPRVSTSSRRRRLELKRWHGPAALIALETSGETGFPSNAFLSYKGQGTKCALEHVRPASSLEQLAAGTWEEAIRELVENAQPVEYGCWMWCLKKTRPRCTKKCLFLGLWRLITGSPPHSFRHPPRHLRRQPLALPSGGCWADRRSQERWPGTRATASYGADPEGVGPRTACRLSSRAAGRDGARQAPHQL